MSTNNTQSIPQDQFLTMAANLLYKAFLDSSRTKSKNIYKELVAGKLIPLTTVKMEDESTVRFNVALDFSEYQGNLNFGAFRSSVSLLISSLGESLRKKEEVTTFSAHQDPNAMIFGVTAVTREGNDPNVMVLGADMSGDNPSVTLKLMYIDHKQFEVDVEETA
ncbi:MAG: hypothetical protein V7746_09425 [Halioglobus sp.]